MSLVSHTGRRGGEHPEVYLIDQGRRLERVVFSLFPQIFSSDAAEFGINQRQQFMGCIRIACAKAAKQLRDLGIHLTLLSVASPIHSLTVEIDPDGAITAK